MATPTRRITTTTTGSVNQKPVAVLATNKIDTLIGSIIQLDGRQSYDPEGSKLSFKWTYVQVPLGSEVEAAGFKDIRPNSTAVSFIPDKIGYYVVQLVVNDGELDSDPVTATVGIQLTRVPVGENITPDAQFFWDYISDFWRLVEDREKITTVWSSVIQAIGAELIKLWSNDYNKSFNTIQSTFQRRWQQLSMVTDLTEVFDQRVIVGKTDSGVGGSSGNIDTIPGVGTTSVFYVPYGNIGDGDRTDFTNLNGNYGAKGRVLVVDGETYTISRVLNQSQEIASGADLSTGLLTNLVTSAGAPFASSKAGDFLTIKSGSNAGTYLVKSVVSSTQAWLVYPSDPPGGPLPSFAGETSLSFVVERRYSLAVVNEEAIPDGLLGASWRVPHLLHTPGFDLEADGVRSGDILTFEVRRADIGLTTEVYAQVTGADRDRLGFEFTLQELDPSVNEGNSASVVESGGIVTATGLQNMRPTSVGGYLEILNGDNPGKYKIRQYVSEDSVVLDNSLAVGADSGNPAIEWIERGKTGNNVSRDIFQKIVRDLRIVPASSGDSYVEAAAENLIRFMPVAVNLSQRPFSKYGITFKATKIRHNSVMRVADELVSAPVLQEVVVDPPVVLKENLDYVVESGLISFTEGLFTLEAPAPKEFWAEVTIYDNASVVERNFGRMVNLSQDDLSQTRTRAPYLSAVKGLFFAYTNGPTVANMRLGLQILLGLPFSEERGVILEVQDSFTVDTSGTALGRMLVEDIDTNGKRLGFRRIYLYPTEVGLESNPATGALYAPGDTIERFAPVSKGVEVVDYVKDPLWWKRALYGLEILKYFTFKVTVDSAVFDANDVQFALDFVKAIKPSYTRVLTSALFDLSDDIIATDTFGGAATFKLYDSPWGLEAANRTSDMNQQGAILWNVGSTPFATRTPRLLKDVVTSNVGGEVRATSATGWDTNLIRARAHDTGVYTGLEYGRLPPIEGDILCVLPGQPGSSTLAGLYEIETVIDANNLKLGWFAGATDPEQYASALAPKPTLNPSTFQYGSGLLCCILRRENPTVLWGKDLVTDGSTNVVQSLTAKFLTNHVRVGDSLCIELGGNVGEYTIDAVENQGAAATVSSPVSGIATVTGLVNMTPASSGGVLEILNGLNIGNYKIVSYVSPTSVTIYHPAAMVQVGTQWRERPRAPYLTETTVALKDIAGDPVVLPAGTAQTFRVIRPFLHRVQVENARTIYDVGLADKVLQAGYTSAAGIGLLGEWRDVFTPGLVGSHIFVTDSQQPSNDGPVLVTSYVNSGRVVVDTSGTNSDTADGSRVYLEGAL